MHVPEVSSNAAKKTLELNSLHHLPLTQYELLAMPDSLQYGLALTRSERIIVVALSYIYTAPTLWGYGKRLLHYLYSTTAEARRQVREQRRREQEQQAQGAPAG
jgi:hypothetical protein